MDRFYLHCWPQYGRGDSEEYRRKVDRETQLKSEGYVIQYESDSPFGIDAFVVFQDEAQAAIFKLTHM